MKVMEQKKILVPGTQRRKYSGALKTIFEKKKKKNNEEVIHCLRQECKDK